jgi:hypothetical protein
MQGTFMWKHNKKSNILKETTYVFLIKFSKFIELLIKWKVE